MTELPVGKPEINFGINKNTFKWPEHGLTVNVERITDEGKAELFFYYDNGTGRKLLHLGNANLMSSTMPRPYITALSTRGLDIDWQTVLTYIVNDTMEHLRQGEPVTWLNSDYGKKRPEYLLPPLFIKNAANIIYADKSSAKSLFMTLVTISLSLPWYNNEIGFKISKDARHVVLFLDWENDAAITGWQKECLVRGMELEWCDIPYLHCSRPLTDSIEHIKNKVTEIKADVVIIDSLGMAVGDDLNLTKPAFNFYSALRQLPVTPIIIAHTSKDITSKRKTVYGNAYYENEARCVWEVSKAQERGSNELTITLHHRKAPPFAGYHEPLAWRFIFEGDKTMVEQCNPESDKREHSESITDTEAVLVILETEARPLLPREIQNLADPPRAGDNIRKACERLKKSNKIKRNEDGRYSLL